MDRVRIQTEDFCLQDEYERLRKLANGVGAVVTFTGLVRDLNNSEAPEQVGSLTLKHYPGMTEKGFYEILAEARARWPIIGATLIHRIGTLYPNDQIVFVGVCTSHREAAFSACQMLMDYLKTRATLWKKVATASGEAWVDQKTEDLAAATRWKSS